MREPTEAKRTRDSSESPQFSRGLGFFDAIYGFAITLLVVNLDIPRAEDWGDLDVLLASPLVDQFWGFTLSFVVIAAFWRVNYGLMRSLTALTPAVITANLVAAFFVVLIPFTTEGISNPVVSELALPTAAYALNIALASIAQTAISVVAARQGVVQVSILNGGPLRFMTAYCVVP